MIKDNFDAEVNWYDIWMQQNKLFFETANKHLNPLFNNRGIHPNLHSVHIDAWLNTLKTHWEYALQQEYYELQKRCCHLLNQLFIESSHLLLQEWLKRADDNNPINTVQELYALWLQCCHVIYHNHMQTKNFQKVYAEVMNTAFNKWKEQSL